MVRLCRGCRISHDCVLQINVVLLLAGLIFLMDVFNHMYVKYTLLREATVFPGVLMAWMFMMRFLTTAGYILNAIVGIRLARCPGLIKFASYMFFSLLLLLYTLSIAATRFVYRSRFELSATRMALLLWRNDKIGRLEEELGCCGRMGLIDYQISAEERHWASGACCGEPGCGGCSAKVIKYLWGIEVEVARDNFILFILLLVGAVVTMCHYKDVQLNTFGDPNDCGHESEEENQQEEEDEDSPWKSTRSDTETEASTLQ
ncbi:uncharacterized protein Tsp42A [Drosophila pseudoobscura]|uniref:Uncharacterized protein Tsp42A n=1 Tax=Drosophila pseudoobscura pseudoobscura TaxID=46245 RepID=A0A6I8UV96_DROPS|nr:uncharacterized protein LOC4804842 [Drosophila pseudoobscura]